jgi:phosphoribosylglycinamide formyltransferase 1
MTGPEMLRVAFCVSGAGNLAKAVIEESNSTRASPVFMILDTTASRDLEVFCGELGIPWVRLPVGTPPQARDFLNHALGAIEFDLLILTFNRIVSPEIVQKHAGKIINVHPALLPAFKGLNSIDQASASGVRYAGATIHEVDEMVDHGAIIAQCVVGVIPGENAAELGAKIYPLLRRMLLQVVVWYACSRISKDQSGRIFVSGARYGELPVSPSLEIDFSMESRN